VSSWPNVADLSTVLSLLKCMVPIIVPAKITNMTWHNKWILVKCLKSQFSVIDFFAINLKKKKHVQWEPDGLWKRCQWPFDTKGFLWADRWKRRLTQGTPHTCRYTWAWLPSTMKGDSNSNDDINEFRNISMPLLKRKTVRGMKI